MVLVSVCIDCYGADIYINGERACSLKNLYCFRDRACRVQRFEAVLSVIAEFCKPTASRTQYTCPFKVEFECSSEIAEVIKTCNIYIAYYAFESPTDAYKAAAAYNMTDYHITRHVVNGMTCIVIRESEASVRRDVICIDKDNRVKYMRVRSVKDLKRLYELLKGGKVRMRRSERAYIKLYDLCTDIYYKHYVPESVCKVLKLSM